MKAQKELLFKNLQIIHADENFGTALNEAEKNQQLKDIYNFLLMRLKCHRYADGLEYGFLI